MERLVLIYIDVMKILNVSRSSSYAIIKSIKDEYPSSMKLTGARVTIKDFAHAYDLDQKEIHECIKSG
jgi:predicted DNA-binding transcriptional regulator AlpA